MRLVYDLGRTNEDDSIRSFMSEDLTSDHRSHLDSPQYLVLVFTLYLIHTSLSLSRTTGYEPGYALSRTAVHTASNSVTSQAPLVNLSTPTFRSIVRLILTFIPSGNPGVFPNKYIHGPSSQVSQGYRNRYIVWAMPTTPIVQRTRSPTSLRS